jgi:hypothetical protein
LNLFVFICVHLWLILERIVRQPRILMCPPDYYGIEYEINPWMNRARGSSRERARQQWQKLHDTLAGLGVVVERLEPQPGLPDLVFTANAGLMFGNRFGSRPTASPSSICRKGCISRGPATRSSAARRCSPAIASAATCKDISTSAVCYKSRCCRWNWSMPTFIISILAFVRSRPARRSGIPKRLMPTGGASSRITYRT